MGGSGKSRQLNQWPLMGSESETGFLERCDQFFASAFAAVENAGPPEDRYLLLADLLGDPNQDLVCTEANARKEALIDGAGPQAEQLRHELQGISKNLATLFAGTSYTVASYWSPLDKQRRSIFRRRGAHEQAPLRLAAAALFYAGTLTGSSRRSPLFPMTSIVQYLSELAPIRPSFTISFQPTGERPHEHTFLVPPQANSIWREAALANLVDEFAQTRTPAELEADLFSVISGSKEGPSKEARYFAARLRAVCRRIAQSLDRDSANYVKEASETLNCLFGSPVRTVFQPQQVLFFAITSQLWRMAVGTDADTKYMHVFPTTVGDTCCILTIGTRDEIDPMRRLEWSYLARSAFIQPLLLDFRTSENRGIENRNNNAFRRILGHNLPKILIQPGMTELVKMDRIVGTLPAEKRAALAPRVQNLQRIFEHYEGFLTSVMCSDKLQHQFDRDPSRFIVEEEIWKYTLLIFDLQRSYASKKLRSSMSIELDVPKQTVLNGHKEFLREVLFIIISNAVQALSLDLVKEDGARAILSLKAWTEEVTRGPSMLVIRIADRGRGFDPIELERFRAAQAQICSVPHEGFWAAVSEMIEKRLLSAQEEHLGIGLIFCLAYLQSLQWAPTLCWPGALDVVSEAGIGTVVTVRVPGVRTR
jgi:hypothetical protein